MKSPLRFRPLLIGLATMLSIPGSFAAPAAEGHLDKFPKIPDSLRIAGFALGCQAYTFNRFGVFEAIEKTRQTGSKTIEFFPGQKLSADEPNVKWDHNASAEVIEKVKAKLAQEKIQAINYGVVGAKNAAEWRAVFEFAKKLGLYAITTEAVQDLDTIEPLVKEYNICVAIHEHARRPNDPEYKVWDPKYVLSVVEKRDLRIGACADTGHWATSGIEPLEGIRILKDRIISCHLKDRPTIGELHPDTIYGTGVSNIKGILDELKHQHFQGNISIEYENNWDQSVPDVAQCVGFVRGWGAANK